jgi:hypothetical protein
VVSVAEPPRPLISVFEIGAATFLSKLLIYPHEAEWTPFQTHCYSENLVAPAIESGTSVSAARNSDHETTEAVISAEIVAKFMSAEKLLIFLESVFDS